MKHKENMSRSNQNACFPQNYLRYNLKPHKRIFSANTETKGCILNLVSSALGHASRAPKQEKTQP